MNRPPHPDHDAVIAAFQRVDVSIRICSRGGDTGYTHIHGPSQSPGDRRCTNHLAYVENRTGQWRCGHPSARCWAAPNARSYPSLITRLGIRPDVISGSFGSRSMLAGSEGFGPRSMISLAQRSRRQNDSAPGESWPAIGRSRCHLPPGATSLWARTRQRTLPGERARSPFHDRCDPGGTSYSAWPGTDSRFRDDDESLREP